MDMHLHHLSDEQSGAKDGETYPVPFPHGTRRTQRHGHPLKLPLTTMTLTRSLELLSKGFTETKPRKPKIEDKKNYNIVATLSLNSFNDDSKLQD
ncbi:hypothetical protein Peur_045806 [Populus x canadensis]